MSTAKSTGEQPALVRPLLTITGIALAANLAIYLVGWLADVEFVVTQGETVRDINAVLVVITTIVPLLLGGLALALTRRWAPTSWRVVAWVGLVVGIVSMPVFLDASTGTKLALSPMHLVTGITWFAVLCREPRR